MKFILTGVTHLGYIPALFLLATIPHALEYVLALAFAVWVVCACPQVGVAALRHVVVSGVRTSLVHMQDSYTWRGCIRWRYVGGSGYVALSSRASHLGSKGSLARPGVALGDLHPFPRARVNLTSLPRARVTLPHPFPRARVCLTSLPRSPCSLPPSREPVYLTSLPPFPRARVTLPPFPRPTYLTSLPRARVTLPSLPESPCYLTSLPESPCYLTSLPESPRYLTSLPESPSYLTSLPKSPVTLALPSREPVLPYLRSREPVITLPPVPRRARVTLPPFPRARVTLPPFPRAREPVFPCLPPCYLPPSQSRVITVPPLGARDSASRVTLPPFPRARVTLPPFPESRVTLTEPALRGQRQRPSPRMWSKEALQHGARKCANVRAVLGCKPSFGAHLSPSG
ncbi:hypothetical protein C7M84_015448 [Penaeus vannamei]|uniref:Uncharacterized protein n=1 Tax=Penaeus vannamei TaxID=6689 RepID=A0A3R7PHD0_PENVA|nr:hypothetical protein C7M84_015448 [Penaeus vannamei]